MFSRDFMIRADDRAFEKASDVLHGVGMDITVHPLVSAVIDNNSECAIISRSSEALLG